MVISSRPSRTLLLLCLCCSCWAFGFGLECPLASRWLQDSGHDTSFIGLNTGTHFFGALLAGVIAPFAVRRFGRGGIAIGLTLSGLSIAAFPWVGGNVAPFALRLSAGSGGALAIILLETMINLNAPTERRARDFAFYACSVAIGFACGTLAGLHLFAIDPRLSFLLGGAVTAVGALLSFWLQPIQAPLLEFHPAASFKPPLLSFGSSWCQGFLEAGMLAMLPLYLRAVGMSDGGTGNLIAAILIGVLLFQIPIGWLADRTGREAVLIGCFGIVAVGLALTPSTVSSASRIFWLFVVGTASGAFYPLGLALLGERLTGAQLPRANAWFVSINCLGSMVGPLVSGATMDQFGPAAMFWSGEVVVCAVLATWLFSRLKMKPHQPGIGPEASKTLLARREAALHTLGDSRHIESADRAPIVSGDRRQRK